ncbi:PTS sugar transporter subunit IIB [Clostridium polynesiense]|uniref:PTS sugar transporter subunit IIB n=1 Tax=Clostridium polynesiense TaxID=1325933 RepID=UPI00058BD95C|nr:PTS sugar transporter subunit IIB [Clostridium polynesiense]
MNILLVCNAGMSTGIMKMRLEEEAQKRGIDATVSAVPLVEIDEHVGNADVILLGPQIRFAADDVSEKAGDKLTMVISPQDFGMMNAVKVMDDILNKIQK